MTFCCSLPLACLLEQQRFISFLLSRLCTHYAPYAPHINPTFLSVFMTRPNSLSIHFVSSSFSFEHSSHNEEEKNYLQGRHRLQCRPRTHVGSSHAFSIPMDLFARDSAATIHCIWQLNRRIVCVEIMKSPNKMDPFSATEIHTHGHAQPIHRMCCVRFMPRASGNVYKTLGCHGSDSIRFTRTDSTFFNIVEWLWCAIYGTFCRKVIGWMSFLDEEKKYFRRLWIDSTISCLDSRQQHQWTTGS